MREEKQPTLLTEELYKYIVRQLGKTEIRITKQQNEINEKDIKKLRLNIKKIRAVFRWIEKSVDQKFTKVHLQKLRTLFKYAGELRDTQVQLELITWYQMNSQLRFGDYRHQLDIAYEKQLSLYQTFVKEFEYSEIERHKNIAYFLLKEVLSEDVLLDKTNKHLSKRYRKIRALLIEPSIEELHTVRVLYKEMIYLLNILDKKLYHLPILSLHIRRLKNFGRQIGKWHDKTILYDAIEEFSGVVCLTKEKEALLIEVKLQKLLIEEEFRTIVFPILDNTFSILQEQDAFLSTNKLV